MTSLWFEQAVLPHVTSDDAQITNRPIHVENRRRMNHRSIERSSVAIILRVHGWIWCLHLKLVIAIIYSITISIDSQRSRSWSKIPSLLFICGRGMIWCWILMLVEMEFVTSAGLLGRNWRLVIDYTLEALDWTRKRCSSRENICKQVGLFNL